MVWSSRLPSILHRLTLNLTGFWSVGRGSLSPKCTRNSTKVFPSMRLDVPPKDFCAGCPGAGWTPGEGEPTPFKIFILKYHCSDPNSHMLQCASHASQ